MKITKNFSPNYLKKKRSLKDIKFIIIHYTGMQSEIASINRLRNSKSKVSCHYLINRKGKVIRMVDDTYIAWHAGKSSWKNYKSLNQNSIGIEITNPGHEHGYKKFKQKQISSLLKLTKSLIKRHNILPKNILGHSDIAPQRKKDPGEKFPWEYLSKKNIGVWHTLKDKQELIKNRKLKINEEEETFFYKNLFKIGYSKKKPLNINRVKYLRELAKAFQRRFRQELVNGKIDRECLLISKNLVGEFK